jgi:hypothetical protein
MMSGVTLEQLAAAAQIVGVITIISGLFFGWFQIRVNRARQRDTIVINLMQTFYHSELARAVNILHALPDGVSADELRRRGPEYEEAAVIISTSFETMGLLVFKRIAKFDLVIELTGGMVISMYRKLQLWLQAVRKEQDQPSWAEWFEWLAHLAEDRKPRQEPAFVAVRGWRP